MNVNQIEIALSQKISASSTNFDLLAASKALQLLRTNGVFVVSSFGGLPAAASNEGKIYFIESIETVVWSNGTDWLQLLDKNQPTIPSELWGWGYNTYGRLGDGTTVDKCSPVREICSATNWCQVSAGILPTAAIKTSGELWTWGRNSSSGTLGDGTTVDKCSPVREFCSATDWCQVSAGAFHIAAIKTSGQIWTWGSNTSSRLGDGTFTDRCSPVREISSATNWCQVCASDSHTAAIKTSGELWSWGSNLCGSLGDGTQTGRCSPVREICSATNWCQVSAGNCHTVAVKTSGELWAWGGAYHGQLGDGTRTSRIVGPVREFCSATDWCQVSGGYRHTVAVKTSGELWAWGNNLCGRLGDGTFTSRCSPVREICSATDWGGANAGFSSVGIKTTGQIWSWGSNFCGRLGNGRTTTSASPVREFCSATDWCQVSTKRSHTTAIKITG
jgi:alpha-tubulin suppressor-like RCC1 family protein